MKTLFASAALAAAFAAPTAALATPETTTEAGVGNYVGVGVLLNRQGVAGNGFDAERTVGGATVQGRYSAAEALGGEISVRPYLNAVGSPAGQIGAGGGALVTYDRSIASKALADGSSVSVANVYGGLGYQVPFVNNTDSNYQAAVGKKGQVVFAVGLEGRLTETLVGFADIKLPTSNPAAEDGAYSPVFTTGVGIKF